MEAEKWKDFVNSVKIVYEDKETQIAVAENTEKFAVMKKLAMFSDHREVIETLIKRLNFVEEKYGLNSKIDLLDCIAYNCNTPDDILISLTKSEYLDKLGIPRDKQIIIMMDAYRTIKFIEKMRVEVSKIRRKDDEEYDYSF